MFGAPSYFVFYEASLLAQHAAPRATRYTKITHSSITNTLASLLNRTQPYRTRRGQHQE